MKTEASEPVLDRLVASLGDCLTPESARLVLALKADSAKSLSEYIESS